MMQMRMMHKDGGGKDEPEDELEEEEVMRHTVQVSRKDAFSGPDAKSWLQAGTLERLQLETLRCWRPVADTDRLGPDDEVVPSTVVYTRKRCGKFKARPVAPGNRQRKLSAAEIFSPRCRISAIGICWLKQLRGNASFPCSTSQMRSSGPP